MADGEDLVVRVDGNLDGLRENLVRTRQELEAASRVGRGFGSSLTRAFGDAAIHGRKLSDVVRGLALSLSRNALQAAIRPIGNAIGGGLAGSITRALGFAKGGVVAGGMPVPFARGGVIAAPAAFSLGNGRLGLAGEAGPEAILPLSRGADGRLGVRADAGASPLAITFNVTTPDAESFQRSESQIAAMLARTVSRGDRNL
jgi:phage-related minor tail protein